MAILTETWGSGIDEFSIDYIDVAIPQTGNDTYYSTDFPDNVFSCWLDENVNTFYTAGSDTNPNHVVMGVDSPLYWHYVSGSGGAWTYDYTPSTTQNDGFFTQYGMRFRDGNGLEHVIHNVSDIQRMVWKPYVEENTETATLYGGDEPTTFKYYVIDYITADLISMDIMKKSDPTELLANVKIMPTMLHNYNKNLIHGYMNNVDHEVLSYWGNSVTRYNGTYSHGQDNADRLSPNFNPLPDLPAGNNQTVWEYDASGKYLMRMSYSSVNYDTANCRYFIADEDHLKFILAGFGLKFEYKGVVYKPIVSGGMVTGYTSDMSQTSEWDSWHDYDDHTVPDTPPPPPTGDNENEEIEMPLAYIGGTGGFVQFIKINSAGLASADDISAALSRFDITTIGKDLLRNFISYKCFAVLNIDNDNTVTRQIKVDGHGLEDENGNPLQGQVIGGLKPIDFTIGTAPRYFNDFRDYAPYTKIEAYVPFCGWFTLPSWCIGLPITGTMFTDLYNGTVKAVIYASDTVVAEVGGCCAYDIPFVADATGSKAGAVISSALATAAATAATVSMPNVATGIAAVTSAANTISAVNSNDTTLKGVLGDGSNLNGLLHCYLKITRPQSPTRNNVIPDTYKHEFGIPTYKELTLASGDGFTQVNDANISGNMTATEKQMIVDGFRHGLIL